MVGSHLTGSLTTRLQGEESQLKWLAWSYFRKVSECLGPFLILKHRSLIGSAIYKKHTDSKLEFALQYLVSWFQYLSFQNWNFSMNFLMISLCVDSVFVCLLVWIDLMKCLSKTWSPHFCLFVRLPRFPSPDHTEGCRLPIWTSLEQNDKILKARMKKMKNHLKTKG